MTDDDIINAVIERLQKAAQCLVYSHAGALHVVDVIARDAQGPAPLGDGSRPTVQRHVNVVRAIVALLFNRGPSAIGRFVIAGCVDPVTHVGVEGREATEPSIAHANTLSAVIREIAPPTVQATSLHRTPNRVLGRRPQAVGALGCDVGISKEATAAPNATGAKVVAGRHMCASAIAEAIPETLTTVRRTTHNDKPTESFPFHFNGFHGDSRSIIACWAI
jgi:hypothetical protein